MFKVVEDQLRNSIEAALLKAHNDPSIDKDQIEGELALEIFDYLNALPTRIITNYDFWRYLSCTIFYDFISWRDGANCSLSSFGLSSRTLNRACVPYRLFLRVNVATNDLPNFKAASCDAALKSQIERGRRMDVWQSHIIGVRNAYAPILVREILAEHSAGRVTTPVIREAAKLIRRKRANLVIELLELPETSELVANALVDGKDLI